MSMLKYRLNKLYNRLVLSKHEMEYSRIAKNLPRLKLSVREKQSAKRIYGKYGLTPNIGWLEYYKYYRNGDFDPYYMTPDLWRGVLEPALNPYTCLSMANKGMLHKYLPKHYLPDSAPH